MASKGDIEVAGEYCSGRNFCTTSNSKSLRTYSSLGPLGGARFHPSTVYWVIGSSTRLYRVVYGLRLGREGVEFRVWSLELDLRLVCKLESCFRWRLGKVG